MKQITLRVSSASLGALLLVLTTNAFAEEADFSRLHLHIEQDLFVNPFRLGHDRNYTMGVGVQVTGRWFRNLGYPQHGVDRLFTWAIPSIRLTPHEWEEAFHSLMIVGSAFTPGSLRAMKPVIGDRPYASVGCDPVLWMAKKNLPADSMIATTGRSKVCEELVAQFVEHVKAQGDGDSLRDGIDAEGMLRLELTVQETLVRLGRAAVQRLVGEVGAGHQGAQVNHGGEVYRFNGYRPRTVHGLYGSVTVLRAYYASSTGKGLAPLDEPLGISHGQTPACEYHMSHFAGSEPYQKGRSHFNLIFRPDGEQKISLHKIEQMIDALGQRLESQRQQEKKHRGCIRARRTACGGEPDHRHDGGMHRRGESADQGQRARR